MPSPIKLKRSLTLPMMVLYGLGTTIGAGIYALIGELAGISGYLAPAAFLLACLLAGLTAFSFAELSGRYPKAAGAALYTQKGLSIKWLSTLVGLLVISAGLVSSAALINAFSGYLNQLISLDRALIIIVTVLLLGALAAKGIVESVLITITMTLTGILGLLIIILVGYDVLGQLPERWSEFVPNADFTSWGFIFAGTLLAFYAFIGFEDMVDVAEEVKDVQRNLPLAIIITLIITVTLYMVIMFIAILSIPPVEIAQSKAPLATLYSFHTGQEATLISFIGMFAIIDGALIQIIMASRVLYGLSCRGQLPALLGRVHPRTQTPLYATAIAVICVLTFALIGRLGSLAELTSLLMLTVFSLVNLSLWRIKKWQPDSGSLINLPRWVPLFAFIVSSTFVLIELYKVIF